MCLSEHIWGIFGKSGSNQHIMLRQENEQRNVVGCQKSFAGHISVQLQRRKK